MTQAEYKAYYTKGYQTDVTKINITDNTMEFVQGGQSKKYTYKYVGKKILITRKVIVACASFLKPQMRMLDSSSMFSLATTISPQLRQNISISSLEAQAKKPSLKKWITGQPTIQITYLAKKSPKKCWRIDEKPTSS